MPIMPPPFTPNPLPPFVLSVIVAAVKALVGRR